MGGSYAQQMIDSLGTLPPGTRELSTITSPPPFSPTLPAPTFATQLSSEESSSPPPVSPTPIAKALARVLLEESSSSDSSAARAAFVLAVRN